MVNGTNLFSSRDRRGSCAFRVVILAAVAAFVGFTGCRKDEDPRVTHTRADKPNPAARDARKAARDETVPGERSHNSQTAQHMLGALGYLDHAEEEADPDEGHGVVLLDEQRSYPGYNLYCSVPDSLAELIDANGRVIQSWMHQPSKKWSRCELLSNGDLLVVGQGGATKDGVGTTGRSYVLRMSWDGTLIWQRFMSAHHDIEVTPRDQIIVLTTTVRSAPDINPNREIRDDVLTILSHDGSVLEEYSLYDLLSSEPTIFSFAAVKDKENKKRRKAIDLVHANSVEWMHHPHLEERHLIYASTNVIVSSRQQDMIAIVNLEERKLVWAWGQGELSGQHEATVLENGNILVFDNGVARSWSRVVEVDPLASNIVWEYKAPNPEDFHCVARGVSQRLPNGNTLISDSSRGEVFEVTRDGQVVWKFLNPHVESDTRLRRGTTRMKRYELSYVDAIMATADKTEP